MREMVRENPNKLPAVFQKVISDADWEWVWCYGNRNASVTETVTPIESTLSTYKQGAVRQGPTR